MRFELVEPQTLAEALEQLDPEDRSVRPIAGGTSLVLMMKQRVFRPARLVSLRRLRGELSSIEEEGEGLRIGSLTTLRQLERSPLVAQRFPALVKALATLSNVRIRNVATLGGHLAHGDPHLDLPPLLIALQARVRVASPRGERWLDLENLYRGYYETALANNELITHVFLPCPYPPGRAAYVKFCSLSADDWPAVGVGVWYRLQDGVISQARVVAGAGLSRPTRLVQAELALVGRPPGEAAFREAADAAAREAEPVSDLRGSAAYKRELIRVHVLQALLEASGGGR